MKQKEIEMLAELVAKKIMAQMGNNKSSDDDEFVDSKEAARILGVTPNYIRSMKSKFPHKKVGSHQQGRILFRRSDLLKNYVK